LTNIIETLDKHEYTALEKDSWKNIIEDYMKSPATNILIADTYQIIDYHSNKSNKPWLIMKERYVDFYGGFGFYQFPSLNSITRTAISNLTENGIIDHLMKRMYEISDLRPEPEPKEPKVLTLEELGIGFKLYGIFIAVAIAFFVVEFFKVNGRKINLMFKGKVFEMVLNVLYEQLYRH